MLIDSGASCSIVYSETLHKNEYVDEYASKIKGICGSIKTIGKSSLNVYIGGSVFQHEFLVTSKFNDEVDGLIGSDFLTKYKANIDYQKFLVSFLKENKRICVQLESSHECFHTVPARCEIIKKFPVRMKCDSVIFPEEITEGVYVAGTVGRPKDGMIPVRLLNTKDKEVIIKNYTPRVDTLENYNFCKFGDNRVMSVERVERVLDTINFESLKKDERTSIEKICAKYADVFHLKDEPLTIAKVAQQKIYLKEHAIPSYVKPYKLPYSQKAEIHKQVEKMLQDGIIEEAKSEWSSPLLIVPKKSDSNGEKKWRLVVDYRLLNKKIMDDKFPLPCVSEILNSLSGAHYFSHLDLANSYYQCELSRSSRPYTAFTTDRGMYQMKRLPMGLKSSPNCFSRCLTIAMAGLNYESCFLYLDDMVVFGKTIEHHNQNLIKIFERLRKTNFKLNPAKCNFLKKTSCTWAM